MSHLRIQHVNVLVDDLAAACIFYGQTLGLQAIPPADQGFPSQFFQFNDDQQLHVNQLPDAKAYRAHFCVVVNDFSATFRRMKAAAAIDIKPWGQVRRLPSGTMQMFVRDPAGNLLEISSAPHETVDDLILADPLVDPTVGVYRIDS